MSSNYMSMGSVSNAMSRVYNYMFVGILLTAIVSFGISTNPALQHMVMTNPLKWPVILAPLACVLIMGIGYTSLPTAILALLFGIVSVAFGASLSVIFLVYAKATIAMALFSSSLVFVLMSAYGYMTKKSLESWGQFLFIGLIGLIISQVVNIFLQSSVMTMTLSALAVIIFTLYTAYDTQKIKRAMAQANSADVNRIAILGALTLYLDFLNLFINLLQLFGGSRK